MQEVASPEEQTEAETTEDAPKSSRKKLEKLIEGTEIKITSLGGNEGQMSFEFLELPEDIQEKLGPFGLGHKLGDAAAGKRGSEAEEAIQRVWGGLMAGDWSVRAPASPKVSVKAIAENYEKLSADEQGAAKALLAGLGIKIPGITE